MDETKVILTLLFFFSFLGIFISAYFIFLQKIRLGYILGAIFILNSVATFAYAMELSISSSREAFIWIIIRYFSGTLSTGANLFFVINISDTPLKFRTRQFISLMAFPTLTILVFAVNPNSPEIYNQIGLLPFKEIIRIDWLLPPLYVLLQIYVSALFAFQYFILFRKFRERIILNQINTLIIATSVSAILIAHLLQMAGWRLLGFYNLLYFIYIPSALLILWGYRRFQLGDIRMIAYNSVFKQMSEAILILDRGSHLIDYNPAAAKILNLSSYISLGQYFDTEKLNLSGFPDYKDDICEPDRQYHINGIPYQINNSVVYEKSGELSGYLISLQDISSQLEAEKKRAIEIEEKAAWKERKNVARILHDSIMQDMNSLILLSNAASDRYQQGKIDRLPSVLESITDSARYAQMEVKKLTQELQVSDIKESGFNLNRSLRERINFVRKQCPAKIIQELPTEFHLSDQVQREIFYIILEALNNAIKHANAQQIWIIITEKDGLVHTEVSDNGVGFSEEDSISHGMGISNMRQRASLIGADFELYCKPGKGVRVSLTLYAQEGNY